MKKIKDEDLQDTLSQEIEALRLLSDEAALKKAIEEQKQELENKSEKIAELKKKHKVEEQK